MKIKDIIVERGFWSAVGRGAADAMGIKLPKSDTSFAKNKPLPDEPSAAAPAAASVDYDIPTVIRKPKPKAPPPKEAPQQPAEPPPFKMGDPIIINGQSITANDANYEKIV